MWLVWYPWPVEITYDQGGEFLGQNFKNSLIENEYCIKTKPAPPGNPQENKITERINQGLGNIVRIYNLQETYVDDADPWMGILAAASFAVRSTYHRKKGKIPVQLVFGRDIILPINHVTDRRYIRYHKQAKIYKDVIREKTNRIDQNYRVGDKFTTKNKSAYKYKTPFKGLYENFHTWKNGTVTLQTGVVTMIINIQNIKPYNTPIVEGRNPLQEL